MTAHQWTYMKKGMIEDTQIGPIEEKQFLTEVRSGEISLDTLVLSDTRTKGKWYKLSQIPGCVKIHEEGVNEREEVKRQAREIKLQQCAEKRQQQVLAVEEQKSRSLELSDCSDYTLVQAISNQVTPILTSGETIRFIAVQKKPVVNIKPDAIVATDRRLIFFRAKMLGRFDFSDYLWRELKDAHLTQGILRSTFTATHTDGRVVSMDYLSKEAATRIYRLAQEKEEAAIEERRRRQMEETRAGAAQIAIQTNVGGDGSGVSAPVVKGDLTQRLMTLKSMLDNGLITKEEFDSRKQSILDEI